MEQCVHPSEKLSKIANSEDSFFCQNCGLIIYQVKNNKFMNTVKPKEHQSNTEIDPIELFINSYKATPFINIEKNSKYLERRSRAIKILEKMNNLYHYSDDIFFLALTYMDYIFKSLYNKNVSLTNKKEELYILNCLLISEKFYDKDINIIPDYNIYLKNTIYYVDTMDIKMNEIDCLKILEYKLDHHSLYDILKAYMYNGFIFEKEIDSNSIGYQIKFAYNYAEKLFRDIVYSYITVFYPPYLIAFIIINLTRKKFFDNRYIKKIKKSYNIKQNDYKECNDQIKILLNNIEKGLKITNFENIKDISDKLEEKEKEREKESEKDNEKAKDKEINKEKEKEKENEKKEKDKEIEQNDKEKEKEKKEEDENKK
jgi:hypothetical protein